MRRVLLLFFLFGFTTVTHAQFKGGFYVGINGSQVDGDNFVGYYKLGLNVGPTAMYPLSDRFDAAFEILYSQKGSKAKTVEGFPNPLFIKLDYVEVPLLINFHAPPYIPEKDKEKNLDKVTLTVGFSLSRLVHNYIYIDSMPNSSPSYFPSNYSNLPRIRSLRNNDYNVILGGAYQFTDKLQINIRYNYSIAQIGTSENSRSKNQGLFNNVISFRLGYILQGKAK